MVEQYGSQCGYCTPGFVVSLFEAYYREDCRDARQLSDQLSGNLCRCTGYRPIRDAALGALAERDRPGEGTIPSVTASGSRFARAPSHWTTRPRGERFLRPTSLADLFAL